MTSHIFYQLLAPSFLSRFSVPRFLYRGYKNFPHFPPLSDGIYGGHLYSNVRSRPWMTSHIFNQFLNPPSCYAIQYQGSCAVVTKLLITFHPWVIYGGHLYSNMTKCNTTFNGPLYIIICWCFIVQLVVGFKAYGITV